MKYGQVYDGDWVRPRRKGYRMMCCDCGLVHVLDFKLVRVAGGKHPKYAIAFTPRRDARATAAARRKRLVAIVSPKKNAKPRRSRSTLTR